MRIAFVSDSIYPYHLGGKEKRLYEISTRLAKRGHHVRIYTMRWWKDGDAQEYEGVHLQAIGSFLALYTSRGRRSLLEAIQFGRHTLLPILRTDAEIIDIDHIPYLSNFTSAIAGRLKKKMIIGTWHEVWGKRHWQEYLGRFKGQIASWIEKLSVKMPHRIISVSQYTTKKLIQELSVSHDRIFTIPNGIDHEAIARAEPSLEKSDLIFVGRLIKHKNLDIVLRVLKKMEDLYKVSLTFFIIGDGPEKNDLQNLSYQLGLVKTVKFFGRIENSNTVYGLLKSSKLFILPSVNEGFGIVVLEANGCGIPVLTVRSLNNAASDLIDEGKNGWVISLRDDDILHRLKEFFNNSSRQGSLSDSSMEISREFSWERTTDLVEQVYRESLNTQK